MSDMTPENTPKDIMELLEDCLLRMKTLGIFHGDMQLRNFIYDPEARMVHPIDMTPLDLSCLHVRFRIVEEQFLTNAYKWLVKLNPEIMDSDKFKLGDYEARRLRLIQFLEGQEKPETHEGDTKL